MTPAKPITRQAVLAYAAETRRIAEQLGNPDPGNENYSPFFKPAQWTDEAAQKLVTRKQNELIDALGPGATAADVEAARTEGPKAALREMKFIVRNREKTFAGELEAEKRRQARHDNQVRPIQKQLDRQRRAMPPGQRIDDALARLGMVAAGTTASLSERVTTGEGDSPGSPPFVGDPVAKAREIALDAAKAVEKELDKARAWRIQQAAA